MKKKILGIICCCLFMAVPVACLGANGWYGGIGAGAIWVTDSDSTLNGAFYGTAEFDTGYAIGGALGYMIENFRIEGEISYMQSDMDTFDNAPADAEIDAITLLVNGYLDFDTGTPVTPYITAGLGASKVELSEPGYSDDDIIFAYQVGAGLGYAISETVTLDCRYRYMSGQDMEITDGADKYEFEVASHNLSVGLRFAF